MDTPEEDAKKLSVAAGEIALALSKTLAATRPGQAKKYAIDEEGVDIAIARGAIITAASSAATAAGLTADDANVIKTILIEALTTAIDERSAK